ncbi:hypothetical protein Daura_06470 [Dactylosporangium aurantiacum]|uniref:Uncharacterized protein n=1 Tax=Dactylosporangium aurantiacum TaxID=35754 RepID=A0A9Q9MIG4_9ACTN|nr:hypothetical protein [Dactylosporangium aurantiacum]MDG6106123.1 hypothetical protein [Dactylosporangium aurantiacum]UWZ55840.1 hypothetical protein Daura_06470 [Dactylosporangium aurantiacum]
MALSEALMTLASAASGGLVGAAMTDAWQQIKARVAGILGRADSDRSRAIERRLDETQRELSSTPAAQLAPVEARHAEAWRTRIADVLEDDPDIAVELARFVEELKEAGLISETGQSRFSAGSVSVSAEAKDHARVFQQGQGVQHNQG